MQTKRNKVPSKSTLTIRFKVTRGLCRTKSSFRARHIGSRSRPPQRRGSTVKWPSHAKSVQGRQGLWQAPSMIWPGEGRGGGAVGPAAREEAEVRAQVRSRATSKDESWADQGGGHRGVLIHDVKSGGSAGRLAIPEADTPCRKGQRTRNDITDKRTGA